VRAAITIPLWVKLMASPVMLRGYEVPSCALAELDGYLARKGVTAADLIGRAADRRKAFADMPVKQDNWRNYVPAINLGPS
jgi:dihydroorotate dehydrogenase (NAD+) catalytic subunit